MEQKPIAETISYLIAQLCKSHRNKASELLSSLDLYPGQELFLLRVWQQDGLMQSEMADNLCIQPATITKMLDRMVKAGLVERRRDLEDQRISRVYLTEAGRALKEPVEMVWHELETATMANFTFDERILLRRLLLQMVENLNQ